MDLSESDKARGWGRVGKVFTNPAKERHSGCLNGDDAMITLFLVLESRTHKGHRPQDSFFLA